MKTTLSDVARIAHVSRGSVSSVLNNKARVRRISSVTALRVRHVADQLGYVPNYCARGLRTQRTQNLGVIIDVSIQHSYLIEIVNHLEVHAKQHGYYIHIGILHDKSDALHYMRSFGANRCDVIVAVSVTVTPELDRQLKELRESGLPVLLVYCGVDPDYDCVCPDLYHSAILGTDCLIHQGRTRIACVGHGPPTDLDHEYVNGHREALTRHQVPFDCSLIYECPADFEIARNLWPRIAGEHPDCTGVLAFNDDIALGLARGIRLSGRTIPGDVAIVAQNNTYPVRIAEVPISSTRYDLDRASELAIQIVMDRLERRGDCDAGSGFRLEKIPPTLVER